MKRLREEEFKKRIRDNVLFGLSDEICIVEFKYKFPDPPHTVVANVFTLKKDDDTVKLSDKRSMSLVKFHLNLLNYQNDNTNMFCYNCIMVPTIFSENKCNCNIRAAKYITISEESTISKTDIILNDNITIDEGEYTVNIIFTGSFCAPIIRIYKDESPLAGHTLRYDLSSISDKVSEDSMIIYNSHYSSINTKNTKSTITEHKDIAQATIDFLIDKNYGNSSLSKENIEYNDNGEVIFYENKQNGITMSKDIKNNGDYEETIKFLDTVISQTKYTTVSEDVIKIESLYDDDIIITKEDKCIIKEIISKKDTTSKIIRLFDNGETVYDVGREIDCTCEYSVNGFNRIYIYPDGTKDIYFDNNIRREFKDENITCLIIDHVMLNGYTIEYSSGERLSYKVSQGLTNFESSSGIQYEFGYDNDIDTNSPIFRYKDNDVFFELGFADNGNFKLLQFKSDYFSDKYLYQRDMFGIPRLVNYER